MGFNLDVTRGVETFSPIKFLHPTKYRQFFFYTFSVQNIIHYFVSGVADCRSIYHEKILCVKYSYVPILMEFPTLMGSDWREVEPL